MKIVIAGAGSVGRSVALELLDHGHECTLIDNQPDKLRVASVADADWVLADACSPDALADAGQLASAQYDWEVVADKVFEVYKLSIDMGSPADSGTRRARDLIRGRNDEEEES